MARDKTDKARAAEAFAEEIVKGFLESEPPTSDGGRCPISYFLWWRFNLRHVDGPNTSYISLDDSAARALCDTALVHSSVRNLVLDIIASRIKNEMPLSADLRNFSFLALKGLLPKPRTSPGPKVSQRFERDLLIIWTLMHMQSEFCVPPTENDGRAQSSTQQPSGMSIIANCFQECGRHEVTSRAVKEVWLDKRKRAWADRIEKAVHEYQETPRNALAF